MGLSKELPLKQIPTSSLKDGMQSGECSSVDKHLFSMPESQVPGIHTKIIYVHIYKQYII